MMRTMLARAALVLTASLTLIGCERWREHRFGDILDGIGSSAVRQPFQDEWRLEVQVPYPPEGIDVLRIGGRLTRNNFANRGDVIVRFDDETDLISIELRRFTVSTSEDLAQADFRNTVLWLSSGELVRPVAVDPADDCHVEWRSGCAIRVAYDGLSQLTRLGADIRVTLPSRFRGELHVITEDTVADDDYLRRGDVCIESLNGSATVELGSGRAFVALADDVTPTPECAPQDVAACEAWTEVDDEGIEVAAAWAPECPCLAQSVPFGELSVRTHDGDAAELTAQIPEGLWASIDAINEGEVLPRMPLHCAAKVDVPGFVSDDDEQPLWRSGTVGFPGPPADARGGYAVSLSSSRCREVSFTESPADFGGEDDGLHQSFATRGRVEVCTNCLPLGCDAQLP